MDDRAETFNELGKNALSDGQLKVAIEYFTEGLAINPSSKELLHGKAIALKDSGALVDAIGTADRLLSIEPGNTEMMELRDECLKRIRVGSSREKRSETSTNVDHIRVTTGKKKVENRGVSGPKQTSGAGIIEMEEYDNSSDEDNTGEDSSDEESTGEDSSDEESTGGDGTDEEGKEDEESLDEDAAKESFRNESPNSVPLIKVKKKDTIEIIVQDDIRRRAMEMTESLLQKIRVFEDEGGEITNLEPSPADISKKMDLGEYAAALEMAENCIHSVEEIQAEFDFSARLVKRVEQNLKDIYTLGIEMENSRVFVDSMYSLIDQGKYEKVRKQCATYIDQIIEKKVLYLDALDSIKSGWNAIRNAADMGIKDGEAEDLLSRARGYLIKGKYDRAEEQSNLCIMKIQEQTGEMEQLILNARDLRNRVEFLQKRGLKVDSQISRADAFIRSLEKNMDMDIKEQTKIHLQLQNTFDETLEKYNKGKLIFQIASQMVNSAREKDIFVPRLEYLQALMLDKLQELDIREMELIIKEFHTIIGDETQKHLNDIALNAIEKVEDNLRECRDIGINVTDHTFLLTRAKSFFNEKDFQSSIESSRMANKKFRGLRLSKLLEDTWLLYKDREHSLGDERKNELLKRVETLLIQENFRKAEKLLTSLREPLFEKKAMEMLERAEILLGGSGADGRGAGELDEPRDLLDRARKSMEMGSFEGAHELLGEALELADSAKELQKLITRLYHVRDRLDDIEAEGVDVSDAKRIFNRARPALDNGYYQIAIDHTEHGLRAGELARQTHFFVLKIRDLENQLSLVKTADGDTQEALNDELASIRKFLENRDFDELELHISSLEKNISDLLNQEISWSMEE